MFLRSWCSSWCSWDFPDFPECECPHFPVLDLDFLVEVAFFVLGFDSCEPAIFVRVYSSNEMKCEEEDKEDEEHGEEDEENMNVCREFVSKKFV